MRELLGREWDVVVLQDQSQIPGGARPLERDAALETLLEFYRPALERIGAEAVRTLPPAPTPSAPAPLPRAFLLSARHAPP